MMRDLYNIIHTIKMQCTCKIRFDERIVLRVLTIFTRKIFLINQAGIRSIKRENSS